MISPASIYTHCDELDNLPEKNRKNWMYELQRLSEMLPKNATVLQVGSMDGTRILRLLEARPDLQITGIEIEPELAELARTNIKNAGKEATIITGDITDPPLDLKKYQYVICLNNTLGYIPNEAAAQKHMRALCKHVLISVYGEAFADKDAREYFSILGLSIKTIANNRFTFDDFTSVKRYTRQEVEAWNGKVEETPLGFLNIS